ncbi:MAG: topoisomerase [Clostridiales bacterium]|jgi:DNA topoisomerase-1|nr:topoisomerase [Clostridiales bacterium]MDK2991935.1 topoisomerase [Clostridiales bacterium]
MANNLVIVESPAKAKTISKFLGRGYKVEASMGHVRDLPKSQMGIDIEHGFEPKYITIRGKGEIVDKLKKQAKAVDRVLLATDPDREGEAISWHLAQLLDIDMDKACRIEFHEITKNAIKDALKHARPIDKNLVDAQQARRVLDRLVGYSISPLLWRKIRKGLSAGRVQSVALRLICDRQQEIDNFVPQEYWTLTALLASDKGETLEARFYGKGVKKQELKDKESVDAVIKDINGSDFIVQKIEKGQRKRKASAPFVTSTLQQEAARKLGFTAKKTMAVAQQLYEGVELGKEGMVGLITYMRTDSVRVSQEAQREARNYIAERFGDNYVPDKPNEFRNRKGTQDAHEAIRPTYINYTPDYVKSFLPRDQYRLYELIYNRFIASQMSDAVYDTISVTIKAGDYIFKASGSTLIFPGHLALYMEGQDDDNDDKEQKLPPLEEGQRLILKKWVPEQHFTQPPPLYTEASLVKALEEKGIGRPSTYAPIISTIVERGYVVREKRTLKPTELGMLVNDMLKEHFPDIVDVSFTAQMEQMLDDVEEGQKDWHNVISEFYFPFKSVLDKADQSIEKVDVPDEQSDVICEKCGRRMVIKQGRYGKFLACPGFPECRNTKPLLEELKVTCPKCGGHIQVKRSKRGRKFYGCENYPQCDFVSWDEPTGELCPECGYPVVIKYSKNGRKYTRCSNKNCKYTGQKLAGEAK